MSRSVPDVLAAAVATDPARPLITYYDDATGERTELSGATLDNWVAKTANLLVDGHGLGPGDTAAVLLPPHWQTAAVLLGCWSAGVGVGPEGSAADIGFATPDRLARADATDVYVLGLAPLAAPLRPGPPAGVADYVVEVRGHGDRFTVSGVRPGTVAAWYETPLTQEELVCRAADRAQAHGLGPGDRVLLAAARSPDPVDWLLAPLVAGASIVLCGHIDPARTAGRIAAERITRDLTGERAD